MDAAGYVALTRQSGLMREMGVVANNIANLSTAGFRREGLLFSEFVSATDQGPSISMARGNTRIVDLRQAGISRDDTVLEVGPGLGILTSELLRKAGSPRRRSSARPRGVPARPSVALAL